MRSFGIVLILLVVFLLGFSFYRGYLELTSKPLPADNKTEIKLIVDKEKVNADLKKAETEAQKATQNIDLDPT